MNRQPDGIEVVATAADAQHLPLAPFLVIDRLREFFDTNGLGSGELTWQRIGEGQANLTYLIRRGSRSFVLRRGPRPPFPPSAHDMVREARIQRLVGESGVAVPNILAVCEDTDVLGVPFYVMNYLDGAVITDQIPAQLNSITQRRATAFASVDALVDLHRLDVSQGELAAIGRPEGYLERQVTRFSAQWEQTTERSLPEVTALGALLAQDIPETQRFTVVHGDYRIGNLMFHHDAPARVVAILDWEMATLGDPLADLGYFTATYATRGRAPTPMELTSVTREDGYPQAEELAARYGDATGLDLSRLGWYQALALWKAAVFCEAIYVRWLHGQRPGDDFAPGLAEGVPALVRTARAIIEKP